MRPGARAVHAGQVGCVEVVLMNERVVYYDPVVAPAGMPAPSSPAAPAATKEKAHIDTETKTEPKAAVNHAGARPEPAGIRVPESGAPNPGGIVNRHIEDVRIGGFDLNRRLSVFRGRADVFLRAGGQLSGLLGFCAHSLDCIHYILLLREKSVAEIGRPGNVVIQTLEHVGKHDQRLHARVPILL